MTASSAERTIRAGLPVIRFMNAYLPLSVTRWVIKQGAARARLPPGVRREAVSADGVACEWLIPHNSPKDEALYLHGGGFIMGLTSLHLEMRRIWQKMGVRALMVDYRLAPECPFRRTDDCVSAIAGC
jgi:acetyl esterase/lipase